MIRLLCWLLLASPVFGADAYLFTSFRGNGETGVFAAVSSDGKKWFPLRHDQPWVQPEHAGMLTRDPWLGRGPDGVWHMLWTWGWTKGPTGPLRIGHSTSRDLMAWSPQEEIRVMNQFPDARNAWAPEAIWDEAKKEWVIFWASTIGGGKDYDHRIYATRTKDWKSFSKSELYFDPGFNCIDSTIVHDGKRWIMIFKDERAAPPVKRLRLAFAASPQGPWSGVTEPFSGDWVEGPTAVKIGSDWWIYFDHYTKPQHYGAMTTRNWKSFTDVTSGISFPEGQRHGTVVKIPAGVARKLCDSCGLP
jgi:hypothetical protein